MKRIIGLVVINTAIVLALSISTEHFFSFSNLVVLIDNFALEAIVLSGYALLLIGGYFDLSVDGIAAISGVTAGLLMTNGMNWIVAVISALLVALFVGLVNGIVVVKLGINGLITTLTTWWICVGFSMGLTKALSPYGFPGAFQWIGQAKVFGFRITVLYALIVVVLLSVVLHLTRTGAHLYVSGDNRQSAEMMGINTTRLGISNYLLVGFLSGIIGLLVASRLNASSPVAVDGMSLRIIAAIVIGGGNLSGGRGSIIGGLLGLSIMHLLSNAIVQLGISPYWQKSMLGGVLLIAVLSEKINLRRILK